MSKLTGKPITNVLAVIGPDNKVWTNPADLHTRAVSSGETPAPFAELPWVKSAEGIFVLGSERNAELIAVLSLESVINKSTFMPKIYVASPGKDFRFDYTHEPAYVLTYMQQLATRAGSTGGFHELENSDVAHYQLMLELAQTKGRVTQTVRRLMRIHPAWPAISFIPTVDEEAVAKLLTSIIDPRWYVDETHPDRLSSLKGFLGLTDRNIGAALSGNVIADRYFKRARNVYTAWAGGMPGTKESIEEPGNFLLRRLSSYDSGICATQTQSKASATRAVLRTCNHFLSFVRNVWMHQIVNEAAKLRNVELFIPEYFFQREEDAAAYREHLENLRE